MNLSNYINGEYTRLIYNGKTSTRRCFIFKEIGPDLYVKPENTQKWWLYSTNDSIYNLSQVLDYFIDKKLNTIFS